MSSYCLRKGIQQKFSAAYSQWMNGIAERNMRTLGEMTTTTMLHANMPPRSWGWAMLLSCEVVNRTVDHVTVNPKPNMSRLERWHGKKTPKPSAQFVPVRMPMLQTHPRRAENFKQNGGTCPTHGVFGHRPGNTSSPPGIAL